MKKRFATVVALVCILVSVCGCGKAELTDILNNTTEEYSYKAPTITEAPTQAPQSTEVYYYTQAPSTDTPAPAPITTQAPQATQTPTLSTAETTEKVYEKTGEMAFSDSGDNKYIKAVAQKYSVNTKNLVALYTVPDNDGNIVLEFDGSTDGNGKLVRTKDTLIAIYSVDKNLNSKRASENLSLNEYSYGEMKVMFISTTKYIMPEFEAQLKG